MMEWQPIESAPEEAPVLVSMPDGNVVSAIKVKTYGSSQWRTNADLFECFYPQLQKQPTAWMKLPEAPK